MEKTYTFDFNLEAWLTGVEVEAENKTKAREKLEEVIEDALRSVGYVKNVEISHVDVEYTRDAVINVTNINYLLDEDDYESEEEYQAAKEVIDELPTEMTIEVPGDDYYYYEKYGVRASIIDVIEEKTGHLVDDFDYDVQEKEE